MADETIISADPAPAAAAPVVAPEPAPAPAPVAAVAPSDPPAGGIPSPQPADGGEQGDWRSRLAGDDDTLKGFLGRYQSEKAFVEAAKKDRDAIRTKQVPKLADDATPEEIAAFRKDMGIPEKPEDYKLSDGLVIGADDKPYVDEFLKNMHGANAPPEMVNAAIETYYDIVEGQMADEVEAIQKHKVEADDLLRKEWGPEYRRNINVVNGFVQNLPAEISEIIGGRHDEKGNLVAIGRDADGMPLADNPAIINWLARLALEANPLSTVAPGGGANQVSAVADEIATLRGLMGNRNSEYWKGPKAEANQARYQQLVEAQSKMRA